MTEDVEMPDAISVSENDLAQKYAETFNFEQVKLNDEVSEETYFAQSTVTLVYVEWYRMPWRREALRDFNYGAAWKSSSMPSS